MSEHQPTTSYSSGPPPEPVVLAQQPVAKETIVEVPLVRKRKVPPSSSVAMVDLDVAETSVPPHNEARLPQKTPLVTQALEYSTRAAGPSTRTPPFSYQAPPHSTKAAPSSI